MDSWENRFFYNERRVKFLILKKKKMQKKLEKLFGKSLKLTLFIFFTIIWSLFVYLINGEWLYFVPIILADVLFFETISWQFWKKKKKRKSQKK